MDHARPEQNKKDKYLKKQTKKQKNKNGSILVETFVVCLVIKTTMS